MRYLPVILIVAAGCLHRPTHYRAVVDVGPDIRALGSEDLFEQGEAVERIVALGPAAVPPLTRALEREPAAVRIGVVEVLGKLDPRLATPPLLRAARDRDEAVRYDALQTVARVGDERSGDVVEQALADPSPKIRLAAARACARVCRKRAALDRLVDMALTDDLTNGIRARATLVAIMAGHDEPASRARAAIEERAVPRLGGSGSLEERARVALLAADVGRSDALALLVETARDAQSLHLRLHALYTLGTIGGREAVPTLAELLQSNVSGVRLYSYDALTRLAARGVQEARRPLASYRGERSDTPLPAPGP